MSYENWGFRSGPPWLQRDVAGALTKSIYAELDYELDFARQALLAGTPTEGPADALPHQGIDRRLPQAVGESDDAFAERLRTCWDAPTGHTRRGSHPGMLRALNRAGFPKGVTGTNIVQAIRRYTYLDADGSTVHFQTFDGWRFRATPRGYWNRFGIVFGADVVGLEDGSQLAKTLNDLVRVWKPAKALYMGAWVMVDGIAWGWPPTMKWGDGGLLWGAGGAEVRFVAPWWQLG